MKLKRGSILLICSILLILGILVIQHITARNGIIFTCSTFFDFKTKDRWTRFCRAMDTLKEHHSAATLSKIRRWIVINEYSDSPLEDWDKKMKERYPWIEFYQKGPSDKGQARTMNILFDKIRGADLWIHWEEAWETRAPFLDDAINTMNTDKEITQLQFTFNGEHVDWLDIAPERIRCSGRICKIYPNDDTSRSCKKSAYEMDESSYKDWPLYSLRPSINRVAHVQRVSNMNEDPKLWPIKFEWEYGCRWMHGAVKAVLKDGPVWRPGKHVSTYG